MLNSTIYYLLSTSQVFVANGHLRDHKHLRLTKPVARPDPHPCTLYGVRIGSKVQHRGMQKYSSPSTGPIGSSGPWLSTADLCRYAILTCWMSSLRDPAGEMHQYITLMARLATNSMEKGLPSTWAFDAHRQMTTYIWGPGNAGYAPDNICKHTQTRPPGTFVPGFPFLGQR